ncbi:MAG: hypothetical protein M3495_10655 [Pseudomonadota bacterium]|nr:hypothetical protein [Gammaproteobacteria bacterium]MDQ3582029.1 hypothetical protein [Pseudomonadota bacterium]
MTIARRRSRRSTATPRRGDWGGENAPLLRQRSNASDAVPFVHRTLRVLCYQYPYQWSNTDDAIKHWLFVLPIDEHRTRMFFLFYFKSFQIPFTRIPIPRGAMDWVLRIANRLLIAPLLDQDRSAVEAEQSAYAQHCTAPIAELNPAVRAFQEVTENSVRPTKLPIRL